MFLLELFAILIGSYFALIFFGRWISSRGAFLRNTTAFFLLSGAAYSISMLLAIWIDSAFLHVPPMALFWPTFTWLSVTIICITSGFQTKASHYAYSTPFFLLALCAAVTPWLSTFPAHASGMWYLAMAGILGFVGAIPISRWAQVTTVVTLQVYMVTMLCAVPYFNWKVAKDDGFVKWILLGEVTATSKAAIWPYYAVEASHPPTDVLGMTNSEEKTSTLGQNASASAE